MMAAGIVLGTYKSEKREDPRMEEAIFKLISKTIKSNNVSKGPIILTGQAEMKKCEAIMKRVVNVTGSNGGPAPVPKPKPTEPEGEAEEHHDEQFQCY